MMTSSILATNIGRNGPSTRGDVARQEAPIGAVTGAVLQRRSYSFIRPGTGRRS